MYRVHFDIGSGVPDVQGGILSPDALSTTRNPEWCLFLWEGCICCHEVFRIKKHFVKSH